MVSPVIDRAVRGAATAPLSSLQKQKLCGLARRAFARVGSGEEFNDWRHAQQLAAVGKGSLRACTQSDYLALRGHFRNLIGDIRQALRDHVASETQGVRVALAKLRQECGKAADVIEAPWDYAASICRTRYGCAPEELAEKKVWVLVFDLRRNVQRRRRRK